MAAKPRSPGEVVTPEPPPAPSPNDPLPPRSRRAALAQRLLTVEHWIDVRLLRLAERVSGKRVSERAILLVGLISLVLVGGNIVLAAQSVARISNREADIQHSQDVLTQIQLVLVTLDDAETGQRGYILTGNMAYLQPFDSAQQTLDQRIALLRTLTQGDANQNARVARLSALVDANMLQMLQTIDLRENGQTQAATQVILSGVGLANMNEIRDLLHTLETKETSRLKTHAAQADASLDGTIVTFVAATLADIALLVLVFALFRLALVQRDVARRQMDDFVSIAGHELKNPLTALMTSLYLVSTYITVPEGETIAPQRFARLEPLFRTATSQVGRMTALINDLLDVSRAQNNQLSMEPTSCDLVALTRLEVESQRLATPDRDITFDAPDLPLVCSVDPNRVRQVIANFITNAVKYSPAPEPVAVRLTAAGDMARIAVRDHGPGVPPEMRDRVWDRFQRVKGAASNERVGVGLGLGLYVCKIIVAAHHGRYGIEDAPDGGAIFWCMLPAATSA